jgi:hypothetical protein
VSAPIEGSSANVTALAETVAVSPLISIASSSTSTSRRPHVCRRVLDREGGLAVETVGADGVENFLREEFARLLELAVCDALVERRYDTGRTVLRIVATTPGK